MVLLKNIFILTRPNQWYKNLIIFLALIFSKNLFNTDLLLTTIKGLVILIIASSANYILNDLIDIKQDRLDPEKKKKRPLAAGKINKNLAIILFFFLFIIALISSHIMDTYFFYTILGIFIISTSYSFFFKNIVFLDLFAISSNFVLRAISGGLLINVFISPWLIIGTFFFALFLGLGKRKGELIYLDKKAIYHRNVLKKYSKKLLFILFSYISAILITIFALYSISSEYKFLIFTLPLFIYLIWRYNYLIISDSDIIRSPEKVIKDKPMLIAGIIFIIISLILIMW